MMNIKQGKEEIQRTVKAYLQKDEFGAYLIPKVRQRPMLFMGPPGIGKTAIMEQVAKECGVALVSYSITHHTRQSAIGLPFISEKNYGGKTISTTEYTMSEIIGAVYDKMETTGLAEGILFIDEINCASETLAPAMLQFLQNKTFGCHEVPDGWLIVGAGNPPEYNKSVREFDVVTLDRVRRISVDANYYVWKEYGYKQGIHGSILSYLEIKKNNFYVIETTVDGKRFVTPRGWEDLSSMIKTYEVMGVSIEESLIEQYLQHHKIAKDFANYYALYCKYRVDYGIPEIVQGNYNQKRVDRLAQAPFDERLSVLGLLLSHLSEKFQKAHEIDLYITKLHGYLLGLKEALTSPYCENMPWDTIYNTVQEETEEKFLQQDKTNLLSISEKRSYQKALVQLGEYRTKAQKTGIIEKNKIFDVVKELFAEETQKRQSYLHQCSEELNYVFQFLEEAFPDGQEIVIFITEITLNYYSLLFIQENGCEKYYKYNKELLLEERERAIMSDIAEINKGVLS